MSKNYPFSFTLESGTRVEVIKKSDDTYDFSLTPAHGATHYFTYIDDNRTKAEVEESLNFEELDALRAFWEHENAF